MAQDIRAWFDSVPPITKWICTLVLLTTLAGNFGLVSPYLLILSWPELVQRFQIWRVVTSFLFAGKLSFKFLVNVVFLYKHGRQLEEEEFRGRPADYLFFVLFQGLVLVVFGLYMEFPVLTLGMMMGIIYYWSRAFENVDVTFWFGITFKGQYLPWALCAFNMLLGGFPVVQLFGILSAHIFYFMTVVYPTSRQCAPLISTPWFLVNLFHGGPAPLGRDNQQGARQPNGAYDGWAAGGRRF
jgi:Derlin-1